MTLTKYPPSQKLKNLDFFPMFKFDFSEIPPQEIEKLRFFPYVQIWLFWNTPSPQIENLDFFPMFKFDFSEIPPPPNWKT